MLSKVDHGRFQTAIAPIDGGGVRAAAARIAERGVQRHRAAFAARQIGRLQVDRPGGVHRKMEPHRVAAGQRMAAQVERRVPGVPASYAKRVEAVRQLADPQRDECLVRGRFVTDRGQRDHLIIAAAVLEPPVRAWRVQPVGRRVGHRVLAGRTGVPHGLRKLQLDLRHRRRRHPARRGLDQEHLRRQLVHAQRREHAAVGRQADRGVQHGILIRQQAQRHRLRSAAVRRDVPFVPRKLARAVAVEHDHAMGRRVRYDQVPMAVAVHVAGGDPRAGLKPAPQQGRRERIAGQVVGRDPHLVDRRDGTPARRIADQVEHQRRLGAGRQGRDVHGHVPAVPNDARSPRDGALRIGVEKRRRLRPERRHQRLARLVQQRDLERIGNTAECRFQPQRHDVERNRLRRGRNRERLVQRSQKGIVLPQLGHAAQGVDSRLGAEVKWQSRRGPAGHSGGLGSGIRHHAAGLRTDRPSRQPLREIAVADRTGRQRVVVLPQHRDAIAAADRQIQVAVLVQIARRQAVNRSQAADRRRRPQLKHAAFEALQDRHRAVAVPDRQIGQRRP